MVQVLTSAGVGAVVAAVVTFAGTVALRRIDARIAREGTNHDELAGRYPPMRKEIGRLTRSSSSAIYTLKNETKSQGSSITIVSGGRESHTFKEAVADANEAYERVDELATDLAVRRTPLELLEDINAVLGAARTMTGSLFLAQIPPKEFGLQDDTESLEGAYVHLATEVAKLDETWQRVDSGFERARIGRRAHPSKVKRWLRSKVGTSWKRRL